jgi:uncharacterized protein YdeI (YjbR/CyaY-like superfamily)
MSYFAKLKRPHHTIPSFVRRALQRNHLMNAYRARPAYQQNDYVGWIVAAKREETAEKRLRQMLAELKKGDVYMNMTYRAGRKKSADG